MDITTTSTITKESSEFFDYLELCSNLSSLLTDFSTFFCWDWDDSVSFAQLIGVFVGSKIPKATKCPRNIRDKSVSCLVTVCIQQVLGCGAEPGRRTVLFPDRGCMYCVESDSSRLRFSRIWTLTLYQTFVTRQYYIEIFKSGSVFSLCLEDFQPLRKSQKTGALVVLLRPWAMKWLSTVLGGLYFDTYRFSFHSCGYCHLKCVWKVYICL